MIGSDRVDVEGLSKGAVLAALYNSSPPLHDGGTGVVVPTPFSGWESFIPQFVHPAKVAVVEALLHIGEPLSVPQLTRLLRGPGTTFSESTIRFHLNSLVKVGMLEIAWSIPVEGKNVREHFYYFASRGPQAGLAVAEPDTQELNRLPTPVA